MRINSTTLEPGDRASGAELLPLIGRAALVGIAYYLTARLSLRLALVGENVTLLWPPSGIAVASMFLFGRRIWPAIVISAFFVHRPISTHVWAAAATPPATRPLIAVLLLHRAGFHPVARAAARRRRDRVDGVARDDRERDDRRDHAPARGNGPNAGRGRGLVGVVAGRRDGGARRRAGAVDGQGSDLARELSAGWPRRLEIGAHLLAVIAVSVLVLVQPYGLLFLILIPMGVTAWRLGQPGSGPAALIACSLAAVAAAHGVGPLDGSLLDRMLTLQSFNVCVALSSFVLAALVTERATQRSALEDLTSDLEHRIDGRTAELSDKNRELERQVQVRAEAAQALRVSERRLAEAQAIAHVGSWEWDLDSDDVSWSAEMYRIHGVDPGETMSFERVMRLIVEDDAAAARRNVKAAFANGDELVPTIEYHVRRPDGTLVPVLRTGRIVFEAEVPTRI